MCTSVFIQKKLEADTRGVLKKNVLKNFAKFIGKHVSQSILFNEVAGLRPATLLKKETLAQIFSYEFCEIFKNTFSYRDCWQDYYM